MAKLENRNLGALELTASTSRVLNLRKVFEVYGEDQEYRKSPFFKNHILNRSLLLKHRLRSSEREEFAEFRTISTKVIIPIDVTDLKLGAFYVFVGQKNFIALIMERLNKTELELRIDLELLNLIDTIPTLDPFMLREYMDREGIKPASCYFRINEADVSRMREFVEAEIGALVRMSFGETGDGEKAKILTKKLLSNSGLEETESLRITLQMDNIQYREGFFCWKAFLYYKWQLSDIIPKSVKIIEEIKSVIPRGSGSKEEKDEIAAMRLNIAKGLDRAISDVHQILETYDDAYRALTEDRNPVVFKNFLLSAPKRFDQLGERLGAVQHLISFWRYRVPEGVRSQMNCEDLTDMLIDFENSLQVTRKEN